MIMLYGICKVFLSGRLYNRLHPRIYVSLKGGDTFINSVIFYLFLVGIERLFLAGGIFKPKASKSHLRNDSVMSHRV
jgi:hypothetical protein